MRNVHYINAGAGSGKTYTLTQTLVKLILDGMCRPSEVILTTFTELAASEFRQKAYDALVKAGYEIEKKQVVLSGPIKNVGLFGVRIKLHPQVSSEINVNVEAL